MRGADAPVYSSLDLSFNLLRSVPEHLEHLPLLSTIYFVQNRISKISGLESLVNLRSLELGGNKIRVRLPSAAKGLPLISRPTDNRRVGNPRESRRAVVGEEQDHEARGALFARPFLWVCLIHLFEGPWHAEEAQDLIHPIQPHN
jgi:hypothetical protein